MSSCIIMLNASEYRGCNRWHDIGLLPFRHLIKFYNVYTYMSDENIYVYRHISNLHCIPKIPNATELTDLPALFQNLSLHCSQNIWTPAVYHNPDLNYLKALETNANRERERKKKMNLWLVSEKYRSIFDYSQKKKLKRVEIPRKLILKFKYRIAILIAHQFSGICIIAENSLVIQMTNEITSNF